jgi:geranylgeranyl diphosphate synthase type II
MTLLAAPGARIDEAIDAALSRIAERARPIGDSFEMLASAAARAASGGKRSRPALVAAAFEAFGGDAAAVPALADVAAAFELLHTAFVVHDDVIDHDTVRRGVPNVAGEFARRARQRGADAAGAALLGEAAAILAGDLLLHEASRLIALAPLDAETRRDLFAILDDAVLVSAAGELADVEHAVLPAERDPRELLAAAHDKTAVYSFSAPLAAGALLAGAQPSAIAALRAAGSRLGLGFQLVDDLIGAFGTRDQAGRAEGADLREAKVTPLVALARESDSWPAVTAAIAAAHTGPVAVREAQRALDASGARSRLAQLIAETLDDALILADDPTLPPPARELVRALARSVEERIP